MKSSQTKLSVNVNKAAVLRNARGKNIPDLIRIAKIVLRSKAHGLTVHPRPDERHIRYKDVFQLKALFKEYPDKEFNIEGYPSPKFLNLIQQIRPQQCTLVPDSPEALTSDAGWNFEANKSRLKRAVKRLKLYNIRASLFLDPLSMTVRQWRALEAIQPDRVELYTESYADSWKAKRQKTKILTAYKKASLKAVALGVQVNAGHDLSQSNLFDLLKAIPEIKEVSIGQALISEALEDGLSAVIKKYLAIISRAAVKKLRQR